MIDAVHQAYSNLPVRTIDNLFITLMAQMDDILHHGGGNDFFPPYTNKRQHEKKTGASIWTIATNIPTFMPKKSIQPTFVFNENDVHNSKAVSKYNKEDHCNTTHNNNETNEDDFYGMAISKILKIFRQRHCI